MKRASQESAEKALDTSRATLVFDSNWKALIGLTKLTSDTQVEILEMQSELLTRDEIQYLLRKIEDNSEQALLISSYFNSLEKEEDVSLSRMYDLLIKAWNQEISADHPVMKAFQYTRAQTVLLLLDTMDVITGKTVLGNDHLFLQENIELGAGRKKLQCS